MRSAGDTPPIVVTGTVWQQQFDELWNLLVPPGGAAATEQGEAIRLAGKLSREILDNGAINWNADFRAMADKLVELLSSRIRPADRREIAELGAVVRNGGGDRTQLYRLTELAVAWVLANPAPAPLTETSYRT